MKGTLEVVNTNTSLQCMLFRGSVCMAAVHKLKLDLKSVLPVKHPFCLHVFRKQATIFFIFYKQVNG